MQSMKPFVVKCRSMKKQWRVWGVGDLHLYNKACVESLVDEMIEEIKNDPYALWIGLGDYADCITAYDPRFDSHEVAPDKRERVAHLMAENILEDLEAKFQPIKKKCLGLLEGNHEKKFDSHARQHENPLVETLCDILGVRYLAYSAAFDLLFKHGNKSSEAFKIYVHHGAGAASTTGGKINKLKKMMVEVCDADIYMSAHTHEQIDLNVVYLYQDDEGVLRQRKKLGVVTGSYLATYRQGSTSYGEMKLYSPVALGSVAVTIVPATRRVGIQKW